MTVFTWMMLGATLLHRDRFRHGSLPFGAWFWIYLMTPVLVPAVWLTDRRRDPGTEEAVDDMFDRWVWGAMLAVGAGLVALAAWMFLPSASWLVRAVGRALVCSPSDPGHHRDQARPAPYPRDAVAG